MTAGPFAPADNLVGPLTTALIGVAQQITGIGRCYSDPPEGEPEDNSVVFPLHDLKVLGDTNAKLKVEFTFHVIHFFRRRRLQDALARAQSFLPAWLNALSAWSNQDLGGLAIRITIHGAQMSALEWGEQPYLALDLTIGVLTEFNIPVS